MSSSSVSPRTRRLPSAAAPNADVSALVAQPPAIVKNSPLTRRGTRIPAGLRLPVGPVAGGAGRASAVDLVHWGGVERESEAGGPNSDI